MIVVDTNIVAYLYLDPTYLPQLEALLQQDAEWIAPRLWRSELRNILAMYLNKGLLRMENALQIMAAAEGLMGKSDYEPASDNVLALAHGSGCTAYDCEFIELARAMGTVVLTFDRKLLERFPTLALTPAQFLAS